VSGAEFGTVTSLLLCAPLSDGRWFIYRRDPRFDALRARQAAADTIRHAYKAYAALKAWLQSDEHAILSRPPVEPSGWKAEDGLMVPVYENSDDERMVRERDALVWRCRTFDGMLLEPTLLDPGLILPHDPEFDPPDVDDVNAGAAFKAPANAGSRMLGVRAAPRGLTRDVVVMCAASYLLESKTLVRGGPKGALFERLGPEFYSRTVNQVVMCGSSIVGPRLVTLPHIRIR
jgi:hypothetical protein